MNRSELYNSIHLPPSAQDEPRHRPESYSPYTSFRRHKRSPESYSPYTSFRSDKRSPESYSQYTSFRSDKRSRLQNITNLDIPCDHSRAVEQSRIGGSIDTNHTQGDVYDDILCLGTNRTSDPGKLPDKDSDSVVHRSSLGRRSSTNSTRAGPISKRESAAKIAEESRLLSLVLVRVQKLVNLYSKDVERTDAVRAGFLRSLKRCHRQSVATSQAVLGYRRPTGAGKKYHLRGGFALAWLHHYFRTRFRHSEDFESWDDILPRLKKLKRYAKVATTWQEHPMPDKVRKDWMLTENIQSWAYTEDVRHGSNHRSGLSSSDSSSGSVDDSESDVSDM